jgi:hypothetical protein
MRRFGGVCILFAVIIVVGALGVWHNRGRNSAAEDDANRAPAESRADQPAQASVPALPSATPAPPAPPPQPMKWRLAHLQPLVPNAFELKGMMYWQVTSVRDSNTASIVEEKLEANRPIEFAVTTPDNFSQMQAGYPAYAIMQVGNGASMVKALPAGQLYFVLFQPRQRLSIDKIPTNGLGLLILAARAIAANQPAEVTGYVALTTWKREIETPNGPIKLW